jgi:hypothetical protein
VKKENDVFAGLLNNGFLTRIEALNNLVKRMLLYNGDIF